MTLVTRAATAEDVKAFYPDLRCSFRAWVCELDGVVQGIIGVALVRPLSCLFSVFREPLRPFLRHLAIMRLIKRAQAAVKASRVPVLAVAEPTEPTAPGILKRLGFEYIGLFDDGEIYGWGWK
jgi:hypothetical protein